MKVKSVRCAVLTFYIVVFGADSARRLLLAPYDQGVSSAMVAAIFSFQGDQYTSSISPLRFLNCCTPHLTLFCHVLCAPLAILSVSAGVVIKFYFFVPDVLSPSSVEIHLIEVFSLLDLVIIRVSMQFFVNTMPSFHHYTAKFSSLILDAPISH